MSGDVEAGTVAGVDRPASGDGWPTRAAGAGSAHALNEDDGVRFAGLSRVVSAPDSHDGNHRHRAERGVPGHAGASSRFAERIGAAGCQTLRSIVRRQCRRGARSGTIRERRNVVGRDTTCSASPAARRGFISSGPMNRVPEYIGSLDSRIKYFRRDPRGTIAETLGTNGWAIP